MGKLHKGCLPDLLIEGVQAGSQRTISEWAKFFKTTYGHIEGTLVRIRKRGYRYHPHCKKLWVGTRFKTGILVDINLKEKYLVSGLNTYEDNYTIPHLINNFGMISDGLKAQPQLANNLEEFAERIQLEVINSRKRYRDVMSVVKKLN